MKFIAILLPVAASLALAGCTSSFSKVSQAVKDAPDWYDDRRKEVRGEGYPELAEIPKITADTKPGKTLPQAQARATGVAAQFEALDAAMNAQPTAATMDARFKEIEARIDASQRAPVAQMTEAQADAIRKKFDVPRVTEPFKSNQ